MTSDEQLLVSSESALWWLYTISTNTVATYWNGYTRGKLVGMTEELTAAINGVTGRSETAREIAKRVFEEARDGNAETEKRKRGKEANAADAG